MHEEILSPQQVRLIPLINEFADNYGLIGGTAIALQIGHRRSIDFDLITFFQIQGDEVRNIIRKNHTIDSILVDDVNELTLSVDNVKITFLYYPFKIKFEEKFHSTIQMPNLLTLASMKAYTLGRRAKWKDYVDLYFIFQKYSFKEIMNTTHNIFGTEFNEKLFREQLAYFKDIDYSESIAYMPGFELENILIQKELEKISLKK